MLTGMWLKVTFEKFVLQFCGFKQKGDFVRSAHQLLVNLNVNPAGD